MVSPCTPPCLAEGVWGGWMNCMKFWHLEVVGRNGVRKGGEIISKCRRVHH